MIFAYRSFLITHFPASRFRLELKNSAAAELTRKVAGTAGTLERLFGSGCLHPRDGLDELMLTILSQNTNDNNRDRAYRQLRERLPDWRAVMEATPLQIEEAIRPAGLSRIKAGRMQAVLRWVEAAFGGLSLKPLGELSDDDAIDLLRTQKGIGIKTAAVLMAFAFERDLCPVDTHIHRIARRLGWVPERASAEATFRALKPHIPAGKARTFHLNLLKFGRTRCTARNPQCKGCPLWNDCSWDGKIDG